MQAKEEELEEADDDIIGLRKEKIMEHRPPWDSRDNVADLMERWREWDCWPEVLAFLLKRIEWDWWEMSSEWNYSECADFTLNSLDLIAEAGGIIPRLRSEKEEM